MALLGDSVHAMMPNLGQGGSQAIEDACVLKEELSKISSRGEIQLEQVSRPPACEECGSARVEQVSGGRKERGGLYTVPCTHVSK